MFLAVTSLAECPSKAVPKMLNDAEGGGGLQKGVDKVRVFQISSTNCSFLEEKKGKHGRSVTAESSLEGLLLKRVSKKKCFSFALGHTLVVLEMH